ncbi:hypothetical protein RCO28_30480 [Streptomyces sp. LHD-70]|uniref:hypothetical protein n=1 Tax=Streptomyces sp. LHD-70 TaxID=3072140 RepID=UPI00280D2443|nr:hypothetical protein [Streptomyces sp. LHD-70]MDQ8706767.1 hypothetical protein [Streptomyces sp. LHD-70]
MSYEDLNVPAASQLQNAPAAPEYVDTTQLPPAEMLPGSLLPLLETRDAAYERWVDHQGEYSLLLSDGWEKSYETRDMVAAAEAVVNGQDPLKIPSELAEARDLRPRVIGAARALARDVIAKDRALAAAFKRQVRDLVPDAGQGLKEAAEAYQEAERAFHAARSRFGAAANYRRFLFKWAGVERPDFNLGGMPLRGDGLNVIAAPGSMEIREVIDSFKDVGMTDVFGEEGTPDTTPTLVTVRNTKTGMELQLSPDQARAVVGSSNNSLDLVILDDSDADAS